MKPAALFKSFDWQRVNGHGDYAMILCDRDRPSGIEDLIGKTVDIDGAPYVLLKVHHRAPAGPLRAGEHVRLLVAPGVPF